MNPIRCRNCGYFNTPDAIYCERCGTQIQNARSKKNYKGNRRSPSINKGVLVALIIFLVIFLGWMALNVIGSRKLKANVPFLPAVYSNSYDNADYVSSDFSISKQESLPRGFGKLNWMGKNKNLSMRKQTDGSYYVTIRRDAKQKKVTIRAISRYYIGLAMASYTVNIAPQGTVDASQVSVPSQDQLNVDKTKAFYNKNGQVDDIYGDLGDVKVSSAEDAIQVAMAYRNIFGLPENITFTCDSVGSGVDSTVYYLNAYLDEYLLYGEEVVVTVGKKNKLENVTNGLHNISYSGSRDSLSNGQMDEEYLLSQHISQKYGKQLKYYAKMNPEVFLFDGKLVHGYYTIDAEGGILCVFLQASDGKVLMSQDGTSSASEINLSDLKGQGAVEPIYSTDTAMLATGVTVRCTNVKGYTEDNKAITVNAGKADTGDYYLIDPTRKIYVYSEGLEGNYSIGQSLQSSLLPTGVLVSSNTSTFSDSVSLETMKWVEDSYDWYKKRWNCNSWDGKGATINVVTHAFTPLNGNCDNAAWHGLFNKLYVNPKEKYTTTTAVDPEVIYHEFTHAVFDGCHFGMGISEDNNAINEAMADIFAYFISGSQTWDMGHLTRNDGTARVFRSSPDLTINGNNETPKTYTDAKAAGVDEAHALSIYVSNVAYHMYMDGTISKKKTQEIWYQAMHYYWGPWCNITKARENVLKAADKLGCSEEDQEYIAYLFSNVGIGDDNPVQSPNSQSTQAPTTTQANNNTQPAANNNNVDQRLIVKIRPIEALIKKKIDIKIYTLRDYSDVEKDQIRNTFSRFSDVGDVSFHKAGWWMKNKLNQGKYIYYTEVFRIDEPDELHSFDEAIQWLKYYFGKLKEYLITGVTFYVNDASELSDIFSELTN